MTIGFVGTHYPKPEYFNEFVDRVHRVAAVLESTAGCLSVACWISDTGDAVVSTALFESDEALNESFSAVLAADVDVNFDDRELKPRSVLKLLPR
ncbi:antibiotic biosynthesis monooxygenase [Nocardia sp. SC052]|uniref:antibiotic biosynthesis monooxygenase n=1 Tax=Nocardia sichangensis TaxID=3385975 RepID=UPI0039A24CA9